MKIRGSTRLAAFAVVAIVMLATASTARAAMKRLWINPASLAPKTPGLTYEMLGYGIQGQGDFIAPVSLPSNAIIRKLRVFAKVGVNPSSVVGGLFAFKPSNLDFEVVAVTAAMWPDPGDPVISTDSTTPGTPVGTGSMITFGLTIFPDDPAVIFYGAQVDYEMP